MFHIDIIPGLVLTVFFFSNVLPLCLVWSQSKIVVTSAWIQVSCGLKTWWGIWMKRTWSEPLAHPLTFPCFVSSLIKAGEHLRRSDGSACYSDGPVQRFLLPSGVIYLAVFQWFCYLDGLTSLETGFDLILFSDVFQTDLLYLLVSSKIKSKNMYSSALVICFFIAQAYNNSFGKTKWKD